MTPSPCATASSTSTSWVRSPLESKSVWQDQKKREYQVNGPNVRKPSQTLIALHASPESSDSDSDYDSDDYDSSDTDDDFEDSDEEPETDLRHLELKNIIGPWNHPLPKEST